MKKIIKNIFCVPKYRTLFLFLIFIGIAIAFGGSVLAQATPPPSSGGSNPLSDLLEAPIRIAVAIVLIAISIIPAILLLIFAALLPVAAAVMRMILIMPLSLTRGGIVDIGWEFCRDIANMFFIIFLLVIAYATIFRKDSYAMRSLLPTLFLVAVLINFSQVICGVVIDICNILMGFFMKYGAADVFTLLTTKNPLFKETDKIFGADYWNPLSQMFGIDPAKILDFVITFLVRILICVIFAGIEFFVITSYSIILIIRIAIIWLLVILSPLAFACYVLPSTRGTWKQWWNYFIQWASIGIFLLFSLYLAGYLLEHTSMFNKCGTYFTNMEISGGGGVGEKTINAMSKIIALILCDFLPYLFAIMVLLIGWNMGMSMGSGAPGFVQKIMKAPMGTANKLYSYGKNSAMASMSKLGADKKGENSWLERAERGLSKSPVGAAVGLPFVSGFRNKAEKAARDGFSDFDNASQETLNNLLKNGTPIQKRNAMASLVSGAASGKLNFSDARDKVSPEALQLLMASGLKSASPFAGKDIIKYADVLKKAPHELAKALSPKAFTDMLTESPSAGGHLGIVGALNEAKSKALIDNGSDNAIAAVRNTLQGIATSIGSNPSSVYGIASGADAVAKEALRAQVEVHVRNEASANRISGVTSADAATIKKISEGVVHAMGKSPLVT